mmetsp:Transcript_6156/g.15224  ORF Transcript_6156/g.15224 Transcript_6156/m.15224 type:complete len:85 (-) Transcript_6156:2261-2515(-)
MFVINNINKKSNWKNKLYYSKPKIKSAKSKKHRENLSFSITKSHNLFAITIGRKVYFYSKALSSPNWQQISDDKPHHMFLSVIG